MGLPSLSWLSIQILIAPTSNITKFPGESRLALAVVAGVGALGAALPVAARLPVARVAGLPPLRLLILALLREGRATRRHLVPHGCRLKYSIFFTFLKLRSIHSVARFLLLVFLEIKYRSKIAGMYCRCGSSPQPVKQPQNLVTGRMERAVPKRNIDM